MMRFKRGQNTGIEFCLNVFSIVLISFFVSCNHHKNPRANKIISSNTTAEDFAAKLSIVLKPVDTLKIKKDIKNVSGNMRYAYELNEYLPIWLTNDQPSKGAASFLKELEDLRWDGLDPERYRLSELEKQYKALNDKKVSDIGVLVAFDTLFTHSYLAAASDLLMGLVNPKKADTAWFHRNDTMWNAPSRLALEDGYPTLNDYRSTFPSYALMRGEYRRFVELGKNADLTRAIDQMQRTNIRQPDSGSLNAISQIVAIEIPWVHVVGNDSMNLPMATVAAYQSYVGLRPTGKLDSNALARLSMKPDQLADKISANMERIRWMGREVGNIYIVVNVPLAELFFRRDGENVMHFRTVVGSKIRQTPSLGASMANVVINPPWGVPPTILKKDVLPGITKSGQKYLAKKGLNAYDRKGKKISSYAVTPGNYKNYTFKQDPGDDNALGYVKFNLPNPWDIYLHDTPHRGDFVKYNRTLSSGCIRLQEPQQMAIYILSVLEKKKFTQETLDSMIETHKTRWEILKNKIPVHILYLTAFEDTTGKHLRLINDVYDRDENLISLLK